MEADQLAELHDAVVDRLRGLSHEDWTRPAAGLDWSCWQTLDHTIDCLFSYTVQVAARAPSGFLPLQELHALATATPADLVTGLHAVGTMFLAVVCEAPPSVMASDGVLMLGLGDWCARAGYELVLHAHDVLSAFDQDLRPPAEICASILSSPTLWMLDRERAAAGTDPWTALLLGSGRAASTEERR